MRSPQRRTIERETEIKRVVARVGRRKRKSPKRDISPAVFACKRARACVCILEPTVDVIVPSTFV